MTVVVFLISLVIATELIAAILGLVDVRAKSRFLPGRFRRLAWAVGITASWIWLSYPRMPAIASATAAVLAGLLLSHYGPRWTTRLGWLQTPPDDRAD